jgi:hypothetical protein
MSKTYELWDTGSRNLIGAHASEADALAFVRAYVDQHGPVYPLRWVLLWDDDVADEAGEIAEGQTLLDLAGVSTDAQTPTEAARRRAG